jgi:alkylation response protein AidB-like acyl-CoA dehydrogenase
MDFDLSRDHELIRRTAREFAVNEVAPVAEHLDQRKEFPYEIVRKLGELGSWGSRSPMRRSVRGSQPVREWELRQLGGYGTISKPLRRSDEAFPAESVAWPVRR